MSNSLTSYPRSRFLLEIVLTAAVYFVLAKLSLVLEFQSSNATPVWPPSGFAFAIILLIGYRAAPGITLGAFAANVLIFLSNKTCDLPAALWVSSLISIGNTGEALAGYYLLRKLIPNAGINNFFLKVNNIFFFLLVASIMCLVSCTVGTTAVLLAYIITPHQYAIVWITWWLGDVSGILLVTPLILIWFNSVNNRAYIFTGSWRGKGEVAALLFAVLLSGGIVFDNWFFQLAIFKWAFWVIPVLMWSAVRFDQRMTATAIAFCSLIAIWGTINSHGPFSIESLNDSLLSMQAFISIICVTTLALNASISERRQTEAILRDVGNQLEIRVKERTSELVHITDQLSEKNIELEKTNQELESFAYVASHDLQEPLRKIRIFADLIRDKEIKTLSESANNYFNKIEGAAGRMQQLILDLLTYSGTNTIEKYFEKTDLNLLLKQVKTELNEKISESNAIVEISELPQLRIIPFQFQQLFTNLITNSIKFSRSGVHPQIYISYCIVEGIELKEIKRAIEKKYHHLTVSDNGIGFDSQFNEQIFGLFKRLNSRDEYEGTGIGLAICKRIVENHNGIISASGELNKGTTFNIYIPTT